MKNTTWRHRISIILIVSLMSCSQTGAKTSISTADNTCKDWAKFIQGEFELHNNVWGKEHIAGYKQCIFRSGAANKHFTQMGWNWDWPVKSESVKAYPSLLFGRKPWHSYSTTTRLPVKIDNLKHLKVTFDITSRASGSLNMLLESWITSKKYAGPNQRKGELAIHLYQHNVPGEAGEYIETVNLSGFSFRFYLEKHMTVPGDDYSWPYFAFVHPGKPILHATLDIRQFVDYLLEHHYINRSQYLATVELGNEIYHGNGKTVIKDFSINTLTK